MTSQRRGLRTLATATILATAGCGTGDTADPPSTSKPTHYVQLTEPLATAALPTEQDLPESWQRTNEGADQRRGGDGMKTEPTECADTYLAGTEATSPKGAGQPTSVTTRFRLGSESPPDESMLVTVQSYDRAYPEKPFDAAGAAVATCGEYTVDVEGGSQLRYELTGINLPNLGDRSFGVRRTTVVAKRQVVTNSIQFAVDNNLVTVEHIGMKSKPDPQLTERVARGVAQDLGASQ